MLTKPKTPEKPTSPLSSIIGPDASELSDRLREHQRKVFAPTEHKAIRNFSAAETAKWIGIKEGYLRKLIADGKVPEPNNPGPRRSFTVDEIHAVRRTLDEALKNTRAPRYSPIRQPGEELQQIAVMNFKGGSGKTTTAVHLAQFLALRGYRVLAVDLDPQASLSALLGYQPEFDVAEGDTIYGAIRYDADRRRTAEIVSDTYISGLHLIPGHLELMEFEHETPRQLGSQNESEPLFFSRISNAIAEVSVAYDVVIYDCPPQLGFLTLSALCAATASLITVHPQMLDVMSMSQFLNMTASLVSVVEKAGASTKYDWMRYVVTRYEPADIPQQQMFGFLKSLFGDRVMNAPMLKSTAIADAGLTKQTLYEVDRHQFSRGTYDRAIAAFDAVNGEIESLIRRVWGRS